MLPQSILSEIMMHLTLPELLQVSQVNKRFYSAASIQRVYKREFISIWMNNCGNPEDSFADWKSLCLYGLRAKGYWHNLSTEIFSETELFILYQEVKSALSHPPIIFPALRRDCLSFPTLIQDQLANSQDQFSPDHDLEDYSDLIYSYLQGFSSALYNNTNNQELLQFRWNPIKSKERVSIGSISTQGSDDLNNSYLISIIKAVKKSVRVYCKGVALILREASDPLQAYCDHWEAFCCSIKKINSLFLPITELLNDFYDARFDSADVIRINLMKIMNCVWRKNVFDDCKEILLDKVIEEVQGFRKNKEEIFWAKSRRVVEALLDLSLNEITVFFKDHSLLKLEGPYYFLHCGVLEHLKEYYTNMSHGFLDEEEILGSIFIKATVRDAARLYFKIHGITNEIINSVCGYERTTDDQLIEFKAESLGIPVAFKEEEMMKVSQCRDYTLIDIKDRVNNYNEDLFFQC